MRVSIDKAEYDRLIARLETLNRENLELRGKLWDMQRYNDALSDDNYQHEKREAAMRFVVNPPAWEIVDDRLTEVQKFLKDFKPSDFTVPIEITWNPDLEIPFKKPTEAD
jgi:NAD-dependent DNA ligase